MSSTRLFDVVGKNKQGRLCDHLSIVIAVVSILFLYGYIPGLSPTKIFGSEYGSFFGSMTGGATGFSAFGFGPLRGVAGLIGYTVLSRIGSVTAAATGPSMSSPDEMMRRMNIPAMFGGMGGPGGMPPAAPLPIDITRSQFVVLQHFRQFQIKDFDRTYLCSD
jgi:hypothetical protein